GDDINRETRPRPHHGAQLPISAQPSPPMRSEDQPCAEIVTHIKVTRSAIAPRRQPRIRQIQSRIRRAVVDRMPPGIRTSTLKLASHATAVLHLQTLVTGSAVVRGGLVLRQARARCECSFAPQQPAPRGPHVENRYDVPPLKCMF